MASIRGVSLTVLRFFAVGGLWIAACWAAVGTRAQAAETPIRRLSGQHLTLYTDLPSAPEVDALPGIFDQAFPQWCAYFGIDQAKHADWHPQGYLMKSKERFVAAGMLPDGLPPFSNGYSRGHKLWLYDQTSPYYRRHLLLHEGTHCFMNTLLGDTGPPWYSEGMAELLATHRLEDGHLTLNTFPRRRSEVPKLGRIEIVQTGYAAGHAMSLKKIMAYDRSAHLQNEPYGWCWAAAAFLDGHPRYRARFRGLQKFVQQPDFSQRFLQVFAADWPLLVEEWQLFVANLDYAYDFERMKLVAAAGKPLPPVGAKISVAADRGWQPSGVRVEAGHRYGLRASGRYQVADKPSVWWCEPGGVTLRYVHGLPLGVLLAAVRPDVPDARKSSPLIRPLTVGTETTLVPKQTGTLYFRVNDSAGKLSDNAGSVAVEITTRVPADE